MLRRRRVTLRTTTQQCPLSRCCRAAGPKSHPSPPSDRWGWTVGPFQKPHLLSVQTLDLVLLWPCVDGTWQARWTILCIHEICFTFPKMEKALKKRPDRSFVYNMNCRPIRFLLYPWSHLVTPWGFLFPVSCFLLAATQVDAEPRLCFFFFAAVRRELHQTLTGFKRMEKPSDCPRNAAQPPS